ALHGVVCSFFFSSRRRHTRFSRDWSSDVCSSDLGETLPTRALAITVRSPEAAARRLREHRPPVIVRREDDRLLVDPRTVLDRDEIGRASCRERVSISVVGGSYKRK